ncbi:MAG: sigma factor, partial [Candidatus Limnocylindrales bacterium]
MDEGGSATRSAIDRVFREESGRVLAALVRIVGDLDLAEEAVQDAFVTAMERWPREGLPRQPGAWITTAARRRAIDRLRRDRRYADKLALLAAEGATGAGATALGGTAGTEPGGMGQEEGAMSSIADDRLRLIFTCCHPA